MGITLARGRRLERDIKGMDSPNIPNPTTSKAPVDLSNLKLNLFHEMRSAILLLSLLGVAFAAQTGDQLGQCSNDQLNDEQCYDAYGFEQCGENGWVYQECPVGTECYNEDSGVQCN
jgi:hypothetical protein